MKQLARLRRNKGFSQRALAQESGVSPATIYELENDRRTANPSTLRKLAEALGVEVVDLLEEDVTPKESAPGFWRVRLRALSAGIKTSTALAAKSVQTGLWLGGTTTEDLQSLNALEAEWGVSSEELLDALMAEKPELADVLDRMARRALENKATHRAEVSNAIEHTGA
jgi:DNA-binding XRE family transcriptional regulator